MVYFNVEFALPAKAELWQVPFPHRRQINQAIHRLRTDPRPARSVGLGNEDDRRLSVDVWWVIYTVDDAARVIRILAIRR